MGESLPDCLVCDRGDPQSFQRLLVPCLVNDPARDELPFSYGVSGDYNLIDILPGDLLFYCVILL